ncbi:MAG TPA: WcaF family extracellular polysaccharide biosynthesis acetyltransferase [Bacteroidia bacterium]|jgi:putative colanic acid biosynthesis acetyltransferase WcaF|nr:WcaF family extracellular polysaccharide biosynthesis acetyltransferase [Bacteroidia bacterium]
MSKTDLSSFNNNWYKPGAGFIVRFMWYCVNTCYFKSSFPFNIVKIFWLKTFGAKIGKGVIIKPGVNIKYPWRLTVGNHVWIGEKVWIDNLGDVVIEDNVCISQGAFLLCGNHDYKKITFDLRVGNINLKQGAWIGAKSTVCPGVTVGSHSVLTVGSIATSDLEEYTIYQGNPAIAVKKREIQ